MRFRTCSADAQLCGPSSVIVDSVVTESLGEDKKEITEETVEVDAEKPCRSGVDSKARVADTCYEKCKTILSGVWKQLDRSAFCCEQIQGGLSNELYLCCLPNEAQLLRGEPRKVVVRFFGEILRLNVHSLVLDSVVFALLSERKLGPKLFGVFPGGRIEEYIPSRSLKTEELWMPTVSKQVAQKMAAFHQLEMPMEKAPRFVFATMLKWLNKIKLERLRAPLLDSIEDASVQAYGSAGSFLQSDIGADRPPLSNTSVRRGIVEVDFEAELEWLKRNVELHSDHFPVVFCHNDLQEGNILYLRDDGHPDGFRLLPIDFEYSSYNYRAFDFGNHFCEWMYDYSAREAPFYFCRPHKYPTKEQRKLFFETYLSNLSDRPVQLTAKEQESMELEAAYGALMSHLFWSLWSVVQQKSTIRFGYLPYARDRIRSYMSMKRYVQALEAQTKTDCASQDI